MASDYAALVHDFYVNQRLNLKMDLSMKRDTVLALFDRIRRAIPQMDRFKRYENELALESRHHEAGDHGSFREEPIEGIAAGGTGGVGGGQQWLAVRRTSVRTGSVNPESTAQGYGLHRLVLEAAPYFLDITPLDIDHLELLYGFDMLAGGNHDAIVYNALLAGSPLGSLVEGLGGGGGGGGGRGRRREHTPVDCQPLLGVALSEHGDMQAHFEVKTRSASRHGRSGEHREEPISLYLVVRKYGPFRDLKDLPGVLDRLIEQGEELLETCVVPKLLVPVRDAIASGHG